MFGLGLTTPHYCDERSGTHHPLTHCTASQGLGQASGHPNAAWVGWFVAAQLFCSGLVEVLVWFSGYTRTSICSKISSLHSVV